MKVLMTGGAGYVGSACLRWMLEQGHEVVAYDNLDEGNAGAVPSDCLVVGDILDTDCLAETMATHKVDAVMHFAAVASVPESIAQPELYYRVNVLGTKSVLDAMRAAKIDRIVFSSTAATYGFYGEMPLREDSSQVPETPYGSTKLAGEWMIKEYSRAYGIGYVLLRYFNACGADLDGQYGEDRRHETHLIPIVLGVALGKRDKLKIYGGDFDTPDGTCVRDYVHTADLAQAHQIAIEWLKPGVGRAYNLGVGRGVSVMEVLRVCEEVVGGPIPHDVVDPRPGDPGVLIASPDKIISELGWNPQHSDIRVVVESAWRWHQNHPGGYVGVDG